MEQYWYRNAVFYSLDVETFYDSNGDGIGDFQGLIAKLENIAGLGASCIWLLPFYPSPNRDNGYDITDYYNVDSRLGTLGDLAIFLNKADQLGLRVIIDLVINHTSVEHPWFQEARKSKDSPYRDFYIWSDKPLEYNKENLTFHGEEDNVWTYDERAGQYYLHRFYNWQPDLNIGNPAVQNEILKIIAFWLRLGIHGFRVDAAEMIIEPYGMKGTDREKLLRFVRDMNEFIKSEKGDALLLAEVNAGPDGMKTFLQDGQHMHMLFNFYVNQHLFASLAERNCEALLSTLKKLPPLYKIEQWLNFLRLHDELSLSQLSKGQLKRTHEAFAPDENMRLYKTGIRRRLAPILNNDQDRIRMAYSLMFSMPGTPLIRYGDEIGMGDDLSLKERASVRTPMQWEPTTNGGFSTAPKEKLVHPVISGGEYGYEKINVLTSQQKHDSLLNWLERMITTRRQCPEIAYGKLFIHPYKDKRLMIQTTPAQQTVVYIYRGLVTGG